MKKLVYVLLLASFMLTACGKVDVKVENTEDKKQEQSVEQENPNEETTEQKATEGETVENVETEDAGEVASEQADSDKQTATKPAESTTQKPSESVSANTTQKPSATPSTSTSQQPSASPSTDTTPDTPSSEPADSSDNVADANDIESKINSEAEINASKYMNYYQEVLRLVNEIRAEAGVQPLTLDTTLCRAASMRAVEMDYNNIMSHTRPDGSDWWTVLDSYGASYGTCGENVAAGYRTPASVVTGWKNSPGHYSNMINASFTKLGVGYSSAGVGDYGHYWCQLFSN